MTERVFLLVWLMSFDDAFGVDSSSGKIKKKNIETRYNPHGLEEKWYPIWENGGYFSWRQNENSNKPPFCIVLPPPNVTGSLHLGHALNHTLQDILIRVHRLKSHPTLWVPGVDHAGIATQNVVEHQLLKENKNRISIGREKFIERVWKWKEESGGMITHQMRQLGESVDWNYERFTLDDGLSKLVKKVFVQLYQEGLIYRREAMINWCPKNQTALSNIEVSYKNQKGKLYFVRYPLKDGGHLLVATTRPETILGDEAIAIHPNDERYKNLLGKKALVPHLNKEIPIIADEYVDMDYGSGAVKITPAHDPNDFEIGRRHSLPLSKVMDEKGHMNELAGKYEGLSREECRKKLVSDLEAEELIEKIEQITHAVGVNERSGAVVEPMLSTQWFVKIRPLADPAIEAIKNGSVRFIPQRWENLYFDWMENIQDWCISRQLWWGHRIPAFYCENCNELHVKEIPPETCSACDHSKLIQDEDVLDTWFSSALWPFSTLYPENQVDENSWPEPSEEIKRFYPNSVLVTGFDIIFFWVARMMMFGIHFQKMPPFRDIYIHGLVRDAERQKMSKSKGNVVNPLEKMEEYGTDAFRFFMVSILPEGKDIIFDESRLKGCSNFCNKIWNTARFIWMNQEEEYIPPDFPPHDLSPMDEWILAEFNEMLSKVEDLIKQYRFAEYSSAVYDFLWKSFCDYYVEISKVSLKKSRNQKESTLWVLNTVFRETLKVLHPIMPFITEEITSFWKNQKPIISAKWPKAFLGDFSEGQKETQNFIETIQQIRKIRAALATPPSEEVPAQIFAPPNHSIQKFEKELLAIGKLSNLTFVAHPENPKPKGVKTLLSFGAIFLDLDINPEKEQKRIEKELQTLQKGISNIQKKLENPKFAQNAPPSLVADEKEKLTKLTTKQKELDQLLKSLLHP